MIDADDIYIQKIDKWNKRGFKNFLEMLLWKSKVTLQIMNVLCRMPYLLILANLQVNRWKETLQFSYKHFAYMLFPKR